VRNLLSNAAKYGGGEGARVTVVVESGPTEASVRVLDEGPGFDDAEAGQLFELFYRSQRAQARASGAGIGLFVCRRLVEAMGGRIWARPRRAGGAEFGFVLKLFFEEDV
jgi:two-component system OmpR family sensor kinase